MTFTIHDADMAPVTADENTSDTSMSFSPSSAVAVDLLAVLLFNSDNVSTSNSDDTSFISVSDSQSNTWTRAAEAQYSAGGVLDGVLNGVFYSVITTQIETSRHDHGHAHGQRHVKRERRSPRSTVTPPRRSRWPTTLISAWQPRPPTP